MDHDVQVGCDLYQVLHARVYQCFTFRSQVLLSYRIQTPPIVRTFSQRFYTLHASSVQLEFESITWEIRSQNLKGYKFTPKANI
jgi:type VI protein secretion system component Hcp